MANLSPEQKARNMQHLNHRARGESYEPGCTECVRERNWQPPTHQCSHCNVQVPEGTNQMQQHLQYHLNNPESITK